MNILLLNYEYPPIGGGAGVCAQEQAKGLAALGHQVVVVTTWFEGEKEESHEGHLKVIRLKAIRKHKHKSGFTEKISWARKALQFLKKYEGIKAIGICMAHFTLPGAFVALKLKKDFNIPYIVISHGHDIPWFFPKQMFIFHLFLYPYLKYLLKNAAATVTLNNKLRKNAQGFAGQNHKVVLIPNGCTPNEDKPSQRPYDKGLKILFTGRLVAQKAPLFFLKGIQLLSQEISDFSVEIYGDGPLKKQMENFVIKHHLHKHISFKGWVDKPTMMAAYNSAHVHVMTSLAEAMSVAALESLTAGLYLISTDVGGNADLIKENVNGNTMRHNKPSELTLYLKKFYKEKYKNNYSIPPSEINHLKEQYAWPHIVKMYEELLQSIIKTESL